MERSPDRQKQGNTRSVRRLRPKQNRQDQQPRPGLVQAVATNRLDRAPLKRLGAKPDLIAAHRLTVHIRVATILVALEKGRRGLAAQIAIDALFIDEELSRDIFRLLLRLVRHVVGKK